MDKRTPRLLALMREKGQHRDKVEAVKGGYEGATAYVLSCGPSLEHVWSPALYRFLSDKLVIAIKRSAELSRLITDMYWYNGVRSPRQDLPPQAIRVACSDLRTFPERGFDIMAQSPDLFLPVKLDNNDKLDIHQSLACTGNFEQSTFDNTFQRPWGPGIMLDFGVQLLLHLGVSRIVVFGWDLSVDGKYTHYYDNDNDGTSDGEKHDIEMDCMPDTSVLLHTWLQSKGVELYLCSPLSSLLIPQIPVEELLNAQA